MSLSPALGIRGQTLDIDITGTNFAAGVSTVGVLGSNITVNSQSVTDGIRNFTVTNSPPEGGTSNQVGFTVGNNPLPTLISVKPDTIARQQTVALTLRGTNFYSGITTVTLGSGITMNGTFP